MKQLLSPLSCRQGQWEVVPRVTDIRMTHFPCLFPLFPFNNPRTSFLFCSAFRLGNVSLFALRGLDSSSLHIPQGLHTDACRARSIPSSRPGPEQIAAAWYRGAAQTLGLMETLCRSLEIPPCLLQPQPEESQPVTDRPLCKGTLQARQPALQ